MRGLFGELTIPWNHVTTVVLTLGGFVLAFALIPRIVMSRRESGATLAWILAIAFLPYAGAILYFLIGRTRVWRRKRQRKRYRQAFLQALDGLPRTAARCDASNSLPDLPRPAAEIASELKPLVSSPGTPAALVETRLSAPVWTSLRKTSIVPFPSSGTRLPDAERKAT